MHVPIDQSPKEKSGIESSSTMSKWLIGLTTLPEKLQGWLANNQSVSIFVTGKTGVGKSTLINGIIGKYVAKEGASLDKGTVVVEAFVFKYQDIDITIWDSPGLQDGIPDNEEQYIKDMKHKGCGNSDLVLYCTQMTQTRLSSADFGAITKLTKGLGKQIWNNAVFVMTFANDVMVRVHRGEKLTPDEMQERNSEFFKQRLEQWKANLVDAVVEAGVEHKIAANIPVVPAGYDREVALPDRDNWLSPLWYASILRMKERSQPALLKANLHRIKLPKQITPEDFKKCGYEQPIIYMPPPVKYNVPAIFSALETMVSTVTGPTAAARARSVANTAIDWIINYYASGGPTS